MQPTTNNWNDIETILQNSSIGGKKKTSLLDEIIENKSPEMARFEKPHQPQETPQQTSQIEQNIDKLLDDYSEIELNIDELDKVLDLKSKAIGFYRVKNYLDALSTLEKAIQILPGDLELLYYEAMCLFQLGNIDRARKIFVRLSEIDKGHSLPSLPKMYALSMLRLNQFADAEIYLKVILAEFQYDTQLQNMLGYALERQDKLNEAEHMYKKVLEETTKNCTAMNSLAYVYFRQNNNLNEALNLVKRALELEPENPAYLDTFAVILHKKGNQQSAKKALKKALQQAPKSEEIMRHIQEIFEIK